MQILLWLFWFIIIAFCHDKIVDDNLPYLINLNRSSRYCLSIYNSLLLWIAFYFVVKPIYENTKSYFATVINRKLPYSVDHVFDVSGISGEGTRADRKTFYIDGLEIISQLTVRRVDKDVTH